MVLFGADAASGMLATQDSDRLPHRPGRPAHRAARRARPAASTCSAGGAAPAASRDDIGGTTGLEDVACLVALNVTSNDLNGLLGDYKAEWHARPNRALLIDRHDDKTQLIVPFVRPGTYEHTD